MENTIWEDVPAKENVQNDKTSTSESSQPISWEDVPNAELKAPSTEQVVQRTTPDVTPKDVELSLGHLSNLSPDTVAHFNRIATGAGVDVETVAQNKDDFERYQEAQSIYKQIGEKDDKGNYKNPNLMRWLLYPENMAIAKDDTGNLVGLERLFRSISPSWGKQSMEDELRKLNFNKPVSTIPLNTPEEKRLAVKRILDLEKYVGVPSENNPSDIKFSLDFSTPIDNLNKDLNYLHDLPEKRRQLEGLKKSISPEEYQTYLGDINSMDWNKSKANYAILSDGAIRFRPEALANEQSFQSALSEAVASGHIDEAAQSRALAAFKDVEARRRESLKAVAEETPSYQKYKSLPENQGKPEDAVFDEYMKSAGVMDWTKGQLHSVVGGASDYVQQMIAGGMLEFSDIVGGDQGAAAERMARILNQSAPSSGDVRIDGTLGSTVGQFAPQLALQAMMAVAFKKAGAGATGTFLGSNLVQGYTAGLQIAAQNYQSVYDANIEQHGDDASREMAMQAFKESLPVGFTENVPIEMILSKLPKGRVIAVIKMLGDAAAEVGQEWAQNEISNAINNSVSTEYPEQQGMSLQQMAEMGAGTLLVTSLVHGGHHVSQYVDARSRVKNLDAMAAQNKAVIDAIGQSAAESKLAARSPEKYAEAVASIKEETGMDNIYIPADKFEEYWQSKNVNPSEIAAKLGISDQMQEAKASGGDLVIPLEAYQSQIAGTEHHAGLSQDLRIGAGDSTLREIEDFKKNVLPKFEEDLKKQYDEEVSSDSSTSGNAVYFDVKSQLQQSGFSEAQAHNYAVLHKAFYETIGGKTGEDALALYKRQGLKIKNVGQEYQQSVQDQVKSINEFIGNPIQEGDGITRAEKLFTQTQDGDIIRVNESQQWEVTDKGAKAVLIENGKKTKTSIDIQGDGIDRAGEYANIGKNGVLEKRTRGLSKSAQSGDTVDQGANLDADFLTFADIAAADALSKKESDARAAMDKLSQEQALHELASNHDDILDVLKKNPLPMTDEALQGELDRVRKFKKGVAQGYFRKKGTKSLHQIREAMNQAGFNFQTESEMLDAIEERIRSGKPMYGFGNQVDEVFQGSPQEKNFDAEYAKLANEAIIGNRNFNTPIPVGKTPAVLLALGVKNLPIVIDQSTLKKAREKHEVKVDDLINKLPQEIRNPVMIFDSKSSGFNVLTSLQNSKGDLVAAAIHLDKNIGRGYVVHDIATVSKRGTGEIQDWLNNGLLRYIDKNRANDLSVKNGLQLPTPESSQTLDGKKVLSKDDVVKQYGELFQGEKNPRGSVQFKAQETAVNLFKSHDLSTFLHESGHVFLNVYGRAAENASASESLKNDWQSVLKWMGVNSFAEIEREHHEKWASAFEAYLQEGKAPSTGLLGAFRSFKKWLVNVYKSIIGSDITPEIRDVFDRMLATDEEIVTVESESKFDPAFASQRESGMTAAEYADYVQMTKRARSEAEEKLLAKALKEKKRELTREWKQNLKDVGREVEKDVDSRKVYQAIHFLSRGSFQDVETPKEVKGLKLSRKYIEETYGKDMIEKLSRFVPPILTDKEHGKHPDVLAEILGYDSGEELLHEIASAPNRSDLIESEIQRIMKERYPDMIEDGRVREEAIKAVYSETRFEVIAAELRALARLGGTYAPPISEIKRFAHDTIQQKKTSQIQAGKYLTTSFRAANKAQTAIANKQWRKAAEFKQQQLLNHYLYKEASVTLEEIDKALRYMRRFEKDTVRANLGKAGADYLQQIDYLMARYEFRPNTSLKEIERRVNLVDFVREQEEEGNQVDVPKEILDEANRVSYKSISVSHFLALRDAVKNIEHLAHLKNELADSLFKRDFDKTVSEITTSIYSNHRLRDDAGVTDLSPSLKDKFVRGLEKIHAEHVKMEFFFEKLDGHKELGAVWSSLFKTIADAESQEMSMMNDATRRLSEIFRRFDNKERSRWFNQKHYFPYLKLNLSHANVIALALNWGNEGNRDAIIRGWGWSARDVNEILSVLSKKEWDMVQSIWDLIDSFWPQISDLQQELTGLVPEKVEAAPVYTRHGKYEGGYYPLKYDAERSLRTDELQQKENTKDLFESNWMRPSTRKGHTMERIGSGSQKVMLDLSVLTDHITNVIHDLTHRKAILMTDKLTQDERVKQAIAETLGDESYKIIRPWLQSVARSQKNPSGFVEKVLRKLRNGATIVNMGWKVTTAIVQPLGYLQTVDVLGEKWAWRGLQKFYGAPHKMLENIRFSLDRSELLKNRMKTFDRDAADFLRGLKADPTEKKIRESFMYLTGLLDMAVAVPSWLGAYEKAMYEHNNDEEKAIAFADRTVRVSQSSGGAKDLAAIQRGAETKKIFTMFYSYFSVLYNLMSRRIEITKEGGASEIPRLVASSIYLWLAPAVLSEIIAGRGPDDDEDWLKWAAKKEIQYPLQSIVLVRDIVNGLTSDYGYEMTPVADALGSIVKLKEQISQGELDKGLARSVVQTSGYWLGLPARQLWMSGDYLWDYFQGNTDGFSLREMLLGRKK